MFFALCVVSLIFCLGLLCDTPTLLVRRDLVLKFLTSIVVCGIRSSSGMLPVFTTNFQESYGSSFMRSNIKIIGNIG